MAETKGTEVSGGVSSALELFFTDSRDYLLDGTGQHIKSDVLDGKVVGIVIGPHWLPNPLEEAISVISELYDDLKKEEKQVSFVYVATDRDEELIEKLKKRGRTNQLDERPNDECFNNFLKKMPNGWLAVPFDDSGARAKLIGLYSSGIVTLAFVGADGKMHTKDGLGLVEKWGAEAFPFNDERIEELGQEAADKAANQSLKSLLIHEKRDYVISNDGEQVQVGKLEGKIVALYFSAHWCPPCQRFTPVLAGIYTELKKKGESFEVVFVSSDEDQASFDNYFKSMPWLAVPFSDHKTKKRLDKQFEVEGIPTLIILDTHGKTMQIEGRELIGEYGIRAYPFTPERLDELQKEEEAMRASQTLEKLFVTDERDFLISHDGQEVKVSSLTGKTVGLYFSAHWCPPCRMFTPSLVSVYEQLKGRGEAFEIVFISSDMDEEKFKEYYASMPWLALPYGDKQKMSLSRHFGVQGIPYLVIVGPDGKTVTSEGRGLILSHGEKAFPFTEGRLAELQREIDAEAEKLEKERATSKHEHPLKLTKDAYGGGSCICDGCEEEARGWVYHCGACGFDLHPGCVLEKGDEPESDAAMSEEEEDGEEAAGRRIVCEGDVCHRV